MRPEAGARAWRPPLRLSMDLLFLLAFAALFAWAIVQARAWPFRAALFPVATASVMLGLVALKVALEVWRLWRTRNVPPAPPTVPHDMAAVVEEDEAAEAETEDVFAEADRQTWARAAGWLALFFGLLWVLGALVAIPLFSAIYLATRGERPLTVALYALGTLAFVWGVFDQLLHTPIPTGVGLDLVRGGPS